MKLNQKTVLVTGATGGIGSQLCKLLAGRGAKLILTCYNEELLRQLQQELGGEHVMVAADISCSTGRQQLLAACTEQGGVDAIINIAGILDFNLFEQQTEALIEKIVTLNLLAVMMLCHGLIPQLRSKPEAAIVNVGSTFGSIGHPGFVAYCASKAGVKCFTEALSRELADSNIHIGYIAPRATSTSLNSDQVNSLNLALGNKSDSPAYVAGEILDLLEHDRSLRFLGWPEKLFVRVNALFPGVVRAALVKKLDVIKHYANQ
jgi:short-subunit dehydrogenase